MRCSTVTAALVLAAVLWGCHRADERSILPADVEVRPGDIVFRRGLGLASHVVCTADIDGQYSHMGLAVDTDSGLMIAHAVPDEPDFPGDTDRVKLDRPERFFSCLRADRGAVCRVPAADSAAISLAQSFALRAYSSHVAFDHDYDDADSSALYCCELVVRAYQCAGIPLAPAIRQRVSVPAVIDVECVMPSDIYRADPVSVVAKF